MYNRKFNSIYKDMGCSFLKPSRFVPVASGKQDPASLKPRAHFALGTSQPPVPPATGSRSEQAGRCPVPPEEPAPRGAGEPRTPAGDKLLQATEARGGTAAQPAACPYPPQSLTGAAARRGQGHGDTRLAPACGHPAAQPRRSRHLQAPSFSKKGAGSGSPGVRTCTLWE